MGGEGKTTYTFSVSVNTFSIEFPLACYQQAGRVLYVSGVLGRTYTLFYPAPEMGMDFVGQELEIMATKNFSKKFIHKWGQAGNKL